MKITIPSGPLILSPCLFLVFLLLAAGCKKKEKPEALSETIGETTPYKSAYKTETEFIVSSILTRFSSLCYQATGNNKPALCKYEVTELEGGDISRPSLKVVFT